MAHNLDFNEANKRHAYFGVKEPAWHGLGITVDEALTSEQAIITAGLDYEVVKAPNFTDLYYDEVINKTKADIQSAIVNRAHDYVRLFIPATRIIQNPSSWSTVRTDTRKIIGTVGSDYTVFQNAHAFDFFDEIVQSKQAIFQTAGALLGGSRIFITAKLPNSIHVVNDDDIDKYLLLTNSHDGSTSIEVMFTNIRVVCNNTLQAAMSTAKTKYRVRHTQNAKDRMKEAQTILGIEVNNSKEAEEFYKALAAKPATDRENLAYIQSVFLTSSEVTQLNQGLLLKDVVSTRKLNILSNVEQYYYEGAGQDLPQVKGTLWAGYNAITGYFQNVNTYKSNEAKMTSLYYGDVYNKTAKATDVASYLLTH